MATDVDEAHSTLCDEAAREANGGAEQFRGLVDGQQLFHDRALPVARNGEAPRSGASWGTTERQGHHQLRAGDPGMVAPSLRGIIGRRARLSDRRRQGAADQRVDIRPASSIRYKLLRSTLR